MDEPLARLPAKLHRRFREIVALTDAFCDAHLNGEFRDLCRDLAAAICAAGLPVTSGKAVSWAAGVVATIGFVNFLGDPSQPLHMTMDQMAQKMGVSPATLHAKAKVIRGALHIQRMDPRFSTKDITDFNPLTWLVEINGLLFDIRQAPPEVQEAAFRRGLIPYVPADRREEDEP
jgi:hypothetical protein